MIDRRAVEPAMAASAKGRAVEAPMAASVGRPVPSSVGRVEASSASRRKGCPVSGLDAQEAMSALPSIETPAQRLVWPSVERLTSLDAAAS